MKLWSYRFFLFAIFFFGCTFTPPGEFFKEVKQVNLADPNYSISLDNYKDGDTIYLYSSLDFKYTLKVASGTLQSVNISFANSTVYSSSTFSGTFNLQNYLKTGIFELKIQYTATSGTGSLADATGNEHVQISKKWILKVDLTTPPSVNVKVSIVNGFLKFTWDKYTKPNFVSYNLSYSRSFFTVYQTIKDPNTTFLIDSSYVGNEPVNLSVYTVVNYGTYSPGYGLSSSLTKNTPIGLIGVKYDQSDSMATVSWKKSPYTSAFGHYDLYADGQLQKSLTNLTDTTCSYKVNAVYGYTNSLELRYVVKYSNFKLSNTKFSTYQSFNSTLSNTVATKKLARSYSWLDYNAGTNSILISKSYGTGRLIYRYDTNLTLIDSTYVNSTSYYKVPYSGTAIYYTKGGSGYIYDKDILTKQETAHSVTYTGTTGPGFEDASGNGLLCYTYTSTLVSGMWKIQDVIYNLNTNTYLYPASHTVPQFSTKFDNMTISDDGKSFTVNGSFYNLTGSTITAVGALSSPSENLIGWRPDNPQELLVAAAGSLKIYNTSNLTLNRTIVGPTGSNFSNYDPITKQALFSTFNDSACALINIDTQKQRAVKVYYSAISSFIGGWLISPNGNYIKL